MRASRPASARTHTHALSLSSQLCFVLTLCAALWVSTWPRLLPLSVPSEEIGLPLKPTKGRGPPRCGW